jgi:hypothetical protein
VSRWLRRGWPDLLALGLLLLNTLAFHWPLITPDPAHRQAYPAGDFYDQFYTFAAYEHDRLWAGELPLWNPYTYGGHPFLADVQAAVFYPPSLLTMLLSGSGPFAPQWLISEAIAHYMLGAAFTYALLRRLTASFGRGPSVVAALLSALTFAFGGYLTGYPPLQLAILETQIWLPLLLLLLDIGLGEQRWSYLLGGGAVWGVALLAGHPQSAMYVLYGALAYGFFRAWQTKLPWHRAVAAQMSWAGIGFGLAAVQLLPAYEFMQLSVRAELPYEALAAGLPLRDLAQVVVPGALTVWSPVYVGIFPLMLAATACLGACTPAWREGRRSTRVVFWAALALVSLILSLGGKGFLYRLFYWAVPGFRLFRSQERAIYLTSFSLAVLVGYGWAWLASAGAPRSWVRRARAAALAFPVLAIAAAAWVGTSRLVTTGQPDPLLLGGLLRWMGLSWAGWAVVRWLVPHRWLGPLCALLLATVDLFSANMGTNLAPGRADQRIYTGEWLQPVLQDKGRFRVVNDFGLPGNVGVWLCLEDMAGASPLRLQAHRVMLDAVPRWRVWQLFGVRYVSTWEHDLPGPFPAVRIAMRGPEWEKDTTYLHRLEPDFAWAWIVHQARQAEGPQALEILASPNWDPYTEVLLPTASATETQAPAEPSSVLVLHRAPEEIVLQADLSAPGWLVLGEWTYPGWRAWVDGESETVRRADYGLRAIPLQAGTHRVVLRFRPLSVYLGGLISGLVLALVLSTWLWRHTRTGAVQ